MQSSQIHEKATKITLNPTPNSQMPKVPDQLWIIKITHVTLGTGKLQGVLLKA